MNKFFKPIIFGWLSLALGSAAIAGTDSKQSEVPTRVAINESVELAKRFGATDSHRYINGVLDKVARRLRTTEINAGL